MNRTKTELNINWDLELKFMIDANKVRIRSSLDLTAHGSLSPIRRGFAPSFVSYKKGCTRLAAASDKAYQLFAPCRLFSPGLRNVEQTLIMR
jgi:hypothetical protein